MHTLEYNGCNWHKCVARNVHPRTLCPDNAHYACGDKLGVMVSRITSCDSNGETGKLKGDRHTCTRWHAHIHGGWEYVSSTEHRKAMQMTCNGHASVKKQWNGCHAKNCKEEAE